MHKGTLQGGKAYVLTFTDDYTRRTWIRLLAHKDEVFVKFQDWLALAERESGCKLKVLRSDGGGEYINRPMQEFLAGRGIAHQLTVARTPQQNGVAERFNRTLMEGVRSML